LIVDWANVSTSNLNLVFSKQLGLAIAFTCADCGENADSWCAAIALQPNKQRRCNRLCLDWRSPHSQIHERSKHRLVCYRQCDRSNHRQPHPCNVADPKITSIQMLAIALLTTTLRSLLIQSEILELGDRLSDSDASDHSKNETTIHLVVQILQNFSQLLLTSVQIILFKRSLSSGSNNLAISLLIPTPQSFTIGNCNSLFYK
jgi:hypothetical protein